MANYISVPRDLAKVKSKVLFNLTKRQIICFGLGALVGLPVFFICKLLGVTISSCVFGMMLVMIPFFLFAMFEKNGQPLEVVLKQIIMFRFIRPHKRPYITDNFYTYLEKQAQIEREAKTIVRKTNRKK